MNHVPRSGANAPRSLIVTLAAVTATGPFAMQIFVPALPAIARDFVVDPATAQLALSVSLFATALATLGYGPVADRFGRRPALLAGLLLFAIGSVACALASDIDTLILGRIVQAIGGAAGMVLSRAIARDLFGATGAAAVISQLTMVMVLAPMVAPAIGGALSDAVSWRAIFWLVAAVAAMAIALTHLGVPESLPRDAREIGSTGLLRGFSELVRKRSFVLLALYPAFSSTIFFTFVAGAPYVMVELMGRPATEYGLYFMLVAGGFIVGNFIATAWSARHGTHAMMLYGMVLAVAGVTLALLANFVGLREPWQLFVPVMISQIGQGMGLPNAQAAVLNVLPLRAGTASALTGFLQSLAAASASQLVGELQDGSAWPMLSIMALGASGALIVALVVRAMPRGKD